MQMVFQDVIILHPTVSDNEALDDDAFLSVIDDNPFECVECVVNDKHFS